MEKKLKYREWSPKLMDSALASLRAQIIRDGLPGLEHVEALIALRGQELGPVPAKMPDNRFRRSTLRRAILAALRDGPKRLPDVARHIAERQPSMTYGEAYRRASVGLVRLKGKGAVVREGKVWGLAGCTYGAASTMGERALDHIS